MLTVEQEFAVNGILQFIETPVNNFADCTTLLQSPAGCGKSHCTRSIADKIRGKLSVAGVAPTHKARKVLDRFLNQTNPGKSPFSNITSPPPPTIKTMTVASLLSKMRAHHYIGVDHYASSGSKVNLYQVFIVDEASMINDEDIKSMINYAFTYKRKMIFVGDKFQIPNPTQSYICKDGLAYKGDSVIFNIQGYELKNNMRQKEGNPIVSIYLELRDAIAELREPNIDRQDKLVNNMGVQMGFGIQFFLDKEKWYEKMAEVFRKSDYIFGKVRIIAYTNDCVKTNNSKIRKLLGKRRETGGR